MSNNTKKQSLLGKTPQKRNAPSKKPQTRVNTAQPATAKTASTKNEVPTKSKKGLFLTLGIIFIVALAFPKPTLLTYKKLGMVSESVYWSGIFGYGTTLFDSHLHPQLDEKRNALYLCADLANPQSCQKYQLIKNNGFISAIASYF